ncbi:MAG: energy transducer TonB [Treponema sp.]|jgi:protein TonB|nr:energy transducer TonB [Treponema sp.]
MNKPALFPLMLGVSVCFHAGLFLFLSVKTSEGPAQAALKGQEETFSLVNIALPEPAAPVPPQAAPKPPPPLPAEPLPVPEEELAEQYLDQIEEKVEAPEVREDRTDPALVSGEGAGHTGTPEGAVEATERTTDKAPQSTEYIKRKYRYLQRRIRDKLVYPAPARKAGIQGVTQVSFTIHEDGRVSAVTILKSSGHPILDEAAMETIYAAAPFPRPPAPARIAIPIAFRLR